VSKHLEFKQDEVYWLHKLRRLNGNVIAMLSLGDTITYKFKDFIIQYSRIQDGGLHQCVLGFDGMDAPLVIQKYNVNITGSY